MTCIQWQELFDKGPIDATTAERTAFLAHVRICTVCANKLYAASNNAAELLKQEGILEQMLMEGAKIVAKLRERDANDPERIK